MASSPVCKKCGGDRVPMESKPGKGGKTFWFVGCPKCNGSSPDPHPRPTEDPKPKEGHWLDEWL